MLKAGIAGIGAVALGPKADAAAPKPERLDRETAKLQSLLEQFEAAHGDEKEQGRLAREMKNQIDRLQGLDARIKPPEK